MNQLNDEDGKQFFKKTIAIAFATALFIILFNVAYAANTAVTYTKPVHETQENEHVTATSTPDEHIRIVIKPTVPEDSFLFYASFCESTHRQFNTDGSVLLGIVDNDDTGRWQINKRYWLKSAASIGYDIDTEQGNYLMAQHILSVQGESAWSASASCILKNFGYVIK